MGCSGIACEKNSDIWIIPPAYTKYMLILLINYSSCLYSHTWSIVAVYGVIVQKKIRWQKSIFNKNDFFIPSYGVSVYLPYTEILKKFVYLKRIKYDFG